MSEPTPFTLRLMQAIRRIGRTETERADRLGYTVRALDYWEKGGGLVPILERLEREGVIHVNDGTCACAPPAEPADAPATR